MAQGSNYHPIVYERVRKPDILVMKNTLRSSGGESLRFMKTPGENRPSS